MFDLKFVRWIGSKYPSLARFLEMLIHSVSTMILFQIGKVLFALDQVLQTKDKIDWRALLLNFDWRAVVSVGVVILLATVNKHKMEVRRAEDKPSVPPAE